MSLAPARWLAVAALATLPLGVVAQAADPANPAEAIATPAYASAFSDYQASHDAKESPTKVWRAINDEMGRLGGHVGQIKQASDPVAPALPKPMTLDLPQTAPMPAGHRMQHQMGGQ
jgi:hypothetical protein